MARMRLCASLASSWPVACSAARFALLLRVLRLLALAACSRFLWHEQRYDLRRQTAEFPPRPVVQEPAQPTASPARAEASRSKPCADLHERGGPRFPRPGRRTDRAEGADWLARKHSAGPPAGSGFFRTEQLRCVKTQFCYCIRYLLQEVPCIRQSDTAHERQLTRDTFLKLNRGRRWAVGDQLTSG